MHSVTKIPDWTMSGIIPPVRLGGSPTGRDRSPYVVDLIDFVEKFSLSEKRIEILQGFLALRKRLHKIGLVAGFQWVDGSFLENIENLESRSPNDIDVVTYFNLPAGVANQTELLKKDSEIFQHQYVKNNFLVDAYFNELGKIVSEREVKQICYWYSMWSHRRDGTWKGFVQLDLNPMHDSGAENILQDKLLKITGSAS